MPHADALRADDAHVARTPPRRDDRGLLSKFTRAELVVFLDIRRGAVEMRKNELWMRRVLDEDLARNVWDQFGEVQPRAQPQEQLTPLKRRRSTEPEPEPE